MTEKEFSHIPVMLNECLDALNIKNGGLYVDGTLGGCGHSLEIAKRGGHIIGIDRDSTAIEVARERMKDYDAALVNNNYDNIKEILSELDVDKIDGALLDLGVSSYQLDTPERGFSYRYDAPLDMRMDKNASLSAYDVVNKYSQSELERVLFDYGEERFSRNIVRKIIETRQTKPIETTFELVDIIKNAMPAKALREGKHPAKRTFQAIRIEVNSELIHLDKTVGDFCDVLNSGGRMAVITFHSLEDRIIKTAFNRLASGCTCPKDFPVCICGNKPKVRVLTRKPILPSDDELKQNPRSASAKLRVIEKI